MKLIAHIVWKDLTRLRWWLVLWVVVLALPILDGVELILHCPLPLQHDHWSRPATHSGLVAIEIIVGFLIATLLWHEDRVTGASQFWTTRPISGGRLLVAKIVQAVTVLWGIPVLVSLPWWLWCGFTSHQVMLAALETAELAAAIGIPVAAVAAVTDTLVRTLIWTAVLIATTVPLFLTTVRGTHDMPLLGSRILLIIALLLVEMVLLTAVRFICRWQRWLIAIVGIAMMASVLLARLSQYVWFDRPQEWKPERAASVVTDFDRVTSKPIGQKTAREHTSNDAQALVTSYFRVSAPAESPSVVPLSAVQRWVSSGGDDLMRPAGFGMLQTLDIDGLHAIRGDSEWNRGNTSRALEGSDATAKRDTEVFVNAPIPLATLDRYRREPPGYMAHLMFAQIRLRIADECGLRPGSWSAHDGCGLRVQTIYHGAGISSVVLVNTHPAPMADILLRWGWRGWLHGSFTGNLAVVNHEAREYQWVRGTKPVTLRVNGVEIEWHSEIIRAGQASSDGQWVPHAEWFDHATLAVVSADTESIFARDISVPKVVMSADTK